MGHKKKKKKRYVNLSIDAAQAVSRETPDEELFGIPGPTSDELEDVFGMDAELEPEPAFEPVFDSVSVDVPNDPGNRSDEAETGADTEDDPLYVWRAIDFDGLEGGDEDRGDKSLMDLIYTRSRSEADIVEISGWMLFAEQLIEDGQLRAYRKEPDGDTVEPKEIIEALLWEFADGKMGREEPKYYRPLHWKPSHASLSYNYRLQGAAAYYIAFIEGLMSAMGPDSRLKDPIHADSPLALDLMETTRRIASTIRYVSYKCWQYFSDAKSTSDTANKAYWDTKRKGRSYSEALAVLMVTHVATHDTLSLLRVIAERGGTLRKKGELFEATPISAHIENPEQNKAKYLNHIYNFLRDRGAIRYNAKDEVKFECRPDKVTGADITLFCQEKFRSLSKLVSVEGIEDEDIINVLHGRDRIDTLAAAKPVESAIACVASEADDILELVFGEVKDRARDKIIEGRGE